MKGDAQVIAMLNDVLTAELTAINQYWVHARMCENWGYQRLWKKIREESIEEMKHADKVIQRILYLDGIPNLRLPGDQRTETVRRFYEAAPFPGYPSRRRPLPPRSLPREQTRAPLCGRCRSPPPSRKRPFP